MLMLAPALLAGPHAGVRHTSPAALSLQAADLPMRDGWTRVLRPQSNAQVANHDGLPVATLRRLGRITGWESDFYRATRNGICCVFNVVARYGTSAEARRAYLYFSGAAGRQGNIATDSRRSAWHGRPFQVDSAETYRDRYLVLVGLGYLVGKPDSRLMMGETRHLAEVSAAHAARRS